MKPNPYRMWSIEFWGDGENYHHASAHETIEGVLTAANEEESEVDWTVNHILITAMTAERTRPARRKGTK